MPRLGEIVRVKNARSRIWLSIPELITRIQSEYEWENFCEVSYSLVEDWIVGRYGWEAMFSIEQADAIVKTLIYSGWNFTD